MQNNDLLEIINHNWPLGIDNSGNIPKLRFQKDDKLIKGYSLNVREELDVDYDKFSDVHLQQQKCHSCLLHRQVPAGAGEHPPPRGSLLPGGGGKQRPLRSGRGLHL